MEQTFENYLKEIHAEDYHGTDDDMTDAFESWLVELQVDDLIQYAQKWGARELQIFKTDIMKDLQKMGDILNRKI